jgi:mannose-6-phosphate isomerase-like protein (cupin superfamily)
MTLISDQKPNIGHMKKLTIPCLFHIVIFAFALSQFSFAQKSGYVLGPKEGESLGPNRIIKASPKSGSNGGVMVLDSLPAGFETTFHAHKRSDEFFYILNGLGVVELDSLKYEIGSGSVIYVPRGTAHNLKVSDNASMNLLFFFDKPGTDEWFREAHEKFFSKSIPMTVDECNEIGRKHGYVCFDKSQK